MIKKVIDLKNRFLASVPKSESSDKDLPHPSSPEEYNGKVRSRA